MGRQPILVCSIDVGISNLGISLSKVLLRPNFTLLKVVACDTLNLPRITSRVCKRGQCVQYRDRSFSHHVRHFLEEYRKKYFDKAAIILVERQPATVYTAIEQIIQYTFPEKVLLQSPMSLHHWMGTVGLSRQEKKAESMRRAAPYVSELPGFVNLKQHKHDLADAVTYTLYYLEQEKAKCEAEMPQNNFRHFEYNVVKSKYF